MKLISGILLPSAASISSTTFLVTLALSLSHFLLVEEGMFRQLNYHGQILAWA